MPLKEDRHKVFFFLTGENKLRVFKIVIRIGEQSQDSFCMSTVIKDDFLLNRSEIITTAQNRFQNGISSYERVRSNIKKNMIKDNLNLKYFFKIVQAFYVLRLHLPFALVFILFPS